MKADEIIKRRNEISNLVHQNKSVKVSELVELFGVSDETIRKDLTHLEKEGILKKKYGGAELVVQKELTPVLYRTPDNLDLKLPLINAAIQLVDENVSSIGIDQGSTMALLANHLNGFPQKEIFTSSLAAILELVHSNHNLYCFGGKYSDNDMSFQNNTTAEIFPDIQLDLCFFGSSGVKNRKGFCTSSLVDAEIKRKLLNKSTKKIVVLDKTKFYSSSLVEVVSWDEIDLVISNKGIPVDYEKMIRAQTKLLLV